jgi:hypothetical protein
LLLFLTLQFDPRLDAGPRAHERVVVSGFRHVSVIQSAATRTQQEQRFGANLEEAGVSEQSDENNI